MNDQKFYLTKAGLENLRKELESLKELKLAKTRGESPRLLNSEDLNPEYITFQEDLNFLEARMVEIANVLKNYEPIKPPSKDGKEKIGLGATVVVEVDRQADEFTLVGSIEANPSLGRISNESPVGKALLGHKVGDEILVSSPSKTLYKIKKINYSLS